MLRAPALIFSFSFTGIIWRVLPDEQSTALVLEIRDKATPQVIFAAIDREKGNLRWQNDTLAATPWTTAVAVADGVLFLQTYTQSTPPQVVALTAVSIARQQTLWERPKGSFVRSAPGSIWIKETLFDKTNYYQLETVTGKELNKSTRPEITPSGNAQFMSVQYPVSYAEESEYWTNIAGFLQSTLQVLPVKMVEYAETGSCMVISYYLYQASQYDNWLAVFDQSGRLQWQEKTGSALPGTGNNTFLITNNRLIFVKEKNQVIGYVL